MATKKRDHRAARTEGLEHQVQEVVMPLTVGVRQLLTQENIPEEQKAAVLNSFSDYASSRYLLAARGQGLHPWRGKEVDTVEMFSRCVGKRTEFIPQLKEKADAYFEAVSQLKNDVNIERKIAGLIAEDDRVFSKQLGSQFSR